MASTNGYSEKAKAVLEDVKKAAENRRIAQVKLEVFGNKRAEESCNNDDLIPAFKVFIDLTNDYADKMNQAVKELEEGGGKINES